MEIISGQPEFKDGVQVVRAVVPAIAQSYGEETRGESESRFTMYKAAKK
jgi:hypothetical protein